MQNVSEAYRESMENAQIRNRGYIKVVLGVVNSTAQENGTTETSSLVYFSDGDIFDGSKVVSPYATCEQDYSKVNGSMYYAPAQGISATYYQQGAVSNSLLGSIVITFGSEYDLNIKGLTIDFSEYYPTEFTITTDNDSNTYTNDTQYFNTEDTFNGVSYIIITPTAMVNGSGRFRILSFTTGIANIFTNEEVISVNDKEYVSAISDSLPSTDMTVVVDNQNQYYNPDNADSALAYMEIGQKITVQHGYDVDGNGTIEWLPSVTTHLKTWDATDLDATFTSVDRFDYELNNNYYKGQYYANGISLYDLAEDVLTDAGLTASEYYIDPYLADITVNNPLPNVTHAQCLQIIANAGRCCLYVDRNDKVHIEGNFIPEVTASTNSQTAYSKVSNITNDTEKDAYAVNSQDFSSVDGDKYFMANGNDYLSTGYISGYISNSSGTFTTNPKVTLTLENSFTFYGMTIIFREVAPYDFSIQLFNEESTQIDEIIVEGNNSTIWTYDGDLTDFATLIIEFSRTTPNSRVFIDSIIFGDVTDYTIYRGSSLIGTPTATRNNRIQYVSVARHTYNPSSGAIKNLKQETVNVDNGDTVTITFNKPCYGYTVSTDVNSATITESGAYYATITFSGMSSATDVKYTLQGYEYEVTDTKIKNTYHTSGEVVEWDNPLITDEELANDVLSWISEYYILGDVTYNIPWRGDPRTDANDMFFFVLKTGETVKIRAFQNELTFNGAWSGNLSAIKQGTRPDYYLSAFEINTPPTTTTFNVGDTFSLVGLTATATLTNGSKVRSIALTNTDVSSSIEEGYVFDGDDTSITTVTVSYTYGGITMSDTYSITVIPAYYLSDFTIDTPPTTTSYHVGETFSLVGLTATATITNTVNTYTTSLAYTDVTSSIAEGYTFVEGDIGTPSVTVSYTYGGVTLSDTVTLTVEEEVHNPYGFGWYNNLISPNSSYSAAKYDSIYIKVSEWEQAVLNASVYCGYYSSSTSTSIGVYFYGVNEISDYPSTTPSGAVSLGNIYFSGTNTTINKTYTFDFTSETISQYNYILIMYYNISKNKVFRMTFTLEGTLASGVTKASLIALCRVANGSYNYFGLLPTYANSNSVATVETVLAGTNYFNWSAYRLSDNTLVNNISQPIAGASRSVGDIATANYSDIDWATYDESKILYLTHFYGSTSSTSYIDIGVKFTYD